MLSPVLNICAEMGVFSKILSASTVVIVGGITAVLVVHLLRKLYPQKPQVRKAVEVFDYLDINIVTTVEACDDVVHQLRKRSMKHKALGFDCEWVSSKSGRQPVALLQLSSHDGYCGLFRLNNFLENGIPNSLKDLLECGDIYKVGVAPLCDGKYLNTDYNTLVLSTIDIRFLVELCNYQSGGLGAMSESLLNVSLDKRWTTRCSNWEASELTPLQVHYAASDAHAAIQIFITVMDKINTGNLKKLWTQDSTDDIWDRLDDICWKYCDLNYMMNHNNQPGVEGSKKDKKRKEKEPKRLYRDSATRSKPLYHNCYLQAPDGELLCTCDNKKALWYVKKNLASLVTEDPLTVRLRFEPAARSTGDVGKYYQTKKENQCVVCGATFSYIRKNVVPREYRRYFPEIMKDHSSHDVLLLCVPCHQRSNMQDQVMRRHLAHACDAPLAHDVPKVFEDATSKKVRMAARALLVHGRKHSLPADRRKQLEALVLAQFPGRSLTDSLLEEAATMYNTVVNEEFTAESHGYRVVSKYLESSGGLLKLEEEWRTHFLTSMKPKFLPHLWSVRHNRDRLKVKFVENRLGADELRSIGCSESDCF